VEVNYPVDVVVAAAKKKKKNFVMGSDEVFGRHNSNSNNNNNRVSTVAAKEVEVEESILVSPRVADAASIQQCSSLFAQKG